MKVLLLNGSPHAKGCTYTALAEAAGALEAAGVETNLSISVQRRSAAASAAANAGRRSAAFLTTIL